MQLTIDSKDLSMLIPVGDKVLIKPTSSKEQTKSGLWLPPGIQEKERLQCGYVIKVGPGIPIPHVEDDTESWRSGKKQYYLELQATEGDLAIYQQANTQEIMIGGEKYVILSHSSIVLLIRDKEMFK